MIFETHNLKKPLVDYIESIFYYKGFKPDHSIERVVPTGHVFIIFELDGFEYHTFDRKTLKPNGNYRNVWVSGMHKDYLSISAHQNSEMFVIQFKTSGVSPFFDIPIHELNNKVIHAQELFGNEILELRTQILNAMSISEKFKNAENWLLKRFDKSHSAAEDVQSILKKIQSQPVSESSTIIASYPNSQKHLINQFKKYFGLTPKVFHRIFRFNEILKQIRNKQKLKWTDIAYEFGYSDQSHFIKEFKEFSGFNPEEFINFDFHKDEPNFFPLDREG
ncbi:helix-turn-helix domain-containing protein [Winogradskyella jejuensis]|uniref:Transcriptional regulator, AraC family n=1 Tax=Winogradskyella jejuensis TaxID=1089305 RepID=A0A1M5SEG2_9FLAO|nr:helix-turn-helix domain-containing protein [Winogradskyella jejuensis]SHH36944.1 transcriptional regulator, AraC family [Winogradskyella jejuensis]